MKQNSEIINSRVGINLDSNRKEWSTHQNFDVMYTLVYQAMEIAGVAQKMPAPVYMNKRGDIVSSEKEAYGEPVQYDVNHSDYIVFVDEVGTNTNMKDDNRVGGERVIALVGEDAKETVSVSDHHYTTLGLQPETADQSCARLSSRLLKSRRTTSWE